MTLPGVLFAMLWQRVEPRTGDILEVPWAGREAIEFPELHRILAYASGPDVPFEIEAYLVGQGVPFACSVFDGDERAFVVMCALDEAAIAIHPAFPRRLPGIARAPSGMLVQMRSDRTAYGTYGELEGVGWSFPRAI